MEITFLDKWDCTHTMTIEHATKTLQEYYDEWPGGLEEIEAALVGLRNRADLFEEASKQMNKEYEEAFLRGVRYSKGLELL